MAVKKLPKRLRSGRRLVAKAAGGRVGLYCLGTPKAHDADYAILLPSGKVKRGMVGSQGYPVPPDGHWTWLRAKKDRQRERKRRRANNLLIKTERDVATDGAKKILPISKAHLCVDCERDVRLRKHSHTLRSAVGSYAEAICCRCARKRGAFCAVYERARGLTAGRRAL